MKNLLRKHPFICLSFGGLLILTIILFVTALSIKNTTEIELRIAPISATVLIDGKPYQNGKFRIESGEHQLHIEKTGFNTKDYSFNTDTTTKIFDYLTETNGGFSWYLDHEEDAILLTSIGDYKSSLLANSYNSKNPIISALPIIYAHYDQNYNYTEYRIDGGTFTDCDSDFCLKITDTTGGNLENAKDKIREAGFNPDDYQILYEYKPIQELK